MLALFLSLSATAAEPVEKESGFVPLFDGKTFTGWEGNLKAFRIEDGAVVATTHLTGLKAFAYTRAEAQIAAVAFDSASGRPLFRLVYGHAGASNALDVAERLGLPRAVVSLARALATAVSARRAGASRSPG